MAVASGAPGTHLAGTGGVLFEKRVRITERMLGAEREVRSRAQHLITHVLGDAYPTPSELTSHVSQFTLHSV